MHQGYFEKRKAKEKKQKIIGAAVAVVAAVGIYLGFDTDVAKITACDVTTKLYVTAEYSEYSCETDFEGETSCGTDTWSEPASDIWTVRTYNNQVTYSDVEHTILTSYEYYTSPMPPRDEGMSRDSDFDNFKNHNIRSMKVYLNRNGEADHFSKTASYNPQCNIDREKEKEIVVKTWYGISYNTAA